MEGGLARQTYAGDSFVGFTKVTPNVLRVGLVRFLSLKNMYRYAGVDWKISTFTVHSGKPRNNILNNYTKEYKSVKIIQET